jgi:hypothetical protein
MIHPIIDLSLNLHHFQQFLNELLLILYINTNNNKILVNEQDVKISGFTGSSIYMTLVD